MDLDYRRLGKQYRKPLMTYDRDEIVFALSRNIMPWESPLHTAVRRGDLFSVKTLLTEKNVNSRSSWGFTPLNVASYCGHVEIIKLLLDLGADIRLDDGQGWTPLHAACRSDRMAAVKLLLDRGAADCLKIRSGNHGIPIFVACKSKGDPNGDIIQLLVGAGADVNARNPKGRTPLMVATSKGHHKKVEHLLKAGADVHAVDEIGMSALHMAVSSPIIVRLLIDAGANVNLRDYRDEIPLERKDLCLEAISVFLEHGAGSDITCIRHKKCNCSIIACMYKSSRASAKRGRGCDKLTAVEKHIIKSEVAGLYVGQEVALINPAVETDCWSSISRDEFRVECETEVAMMKTGKIPGSYSTYLDALLQRPYVLKHVDPPSLEHCREKFSIYGELIWSRFLSGRRKLPFVDESIDFFSMAEDVPQDVPPECIAEILSYLSVGDLKNLVSIYNSARRRRSSTQPGQEEPNENNKRANADSSLQVMKYLKVA